MSGLIALIGKISRRIFPPSVNNNMQKMYFLYLKYYFKIFGRGYTPAETTKAKKRRLREKFFEKYCKGKGLDVGYGSDPVVENAVGWDIEDGDAQYLKGLKDESFDFVYASHTLEHMVDPWIALKNWWRVLNKGGNLIIYLPHRDLYEKKKTLPSRWNIDHKYFFLVDYHEKPHTLGLKQLFDEALENFETIYIKVCDEGHTITDPFVHSDGEYSIEAVIRKL